MEVFFEENVRTDIGRSQCVFWETLYQRYTDMGIPDP